VSALYDALYAAEEPGVRAMLLLADACFVMPSVLLAESLVARQARVWMYQFDWSPGDSRRRALHAADQAFFFGTLDSSGARLIIGRPADDADAALRWRLSRDMQDALLRFVHGGDPERADATPWPPYAADRRVMHLDAPACRVLDNAWAARWSWWNDNVFEPVLSREPG
jgi:carboxylesterase type B